MDAVVLSRRIQLEAMRLGFAACGISRAETLSPEAHRMEQWLAAGKHGKMAYLENYFDKRIDPRLLVPGARSVISVVKNYYAPEPCQVPAKISRYALGKDYHHVIKEQLQALLDFIGSELGAMPQARIFVDSAPVLERAWATRAGLGWMGKHTLVLNRKMGSFFFLGEIILDVPLHYHEGAPADHCGTCTRCIDACPTQALTPYELDARKCISYLTIELKETIPPELAPQLEGWAFGCDICQEVCPWNRFARPHEEPAFKLTDFLRETDGPAWRALTSSAYRKQVKGSALSRVKLDKLLDNLDKASRSK
ncbi:MAG: tRNA epoxyqueuosine(34) reductase QueG [Bacteroidetes bacterium]|nr:tRNA epoxyqueuosine(34) reductase QueG [Bacteroidota bacterium]